MDESHLSYLHSLDHSTIPMFSFRGMRFIARVVDVYDGDTFTALFVYENRPYKYRIRCLGYNSPEIRPPLKTENREQVIEQAKKARDRLRELLCSHPSHCVQLYCHHFDKYGRILGEVFPLGVCVESSPSINKQMLQEGHGVVYME